MDSTRSYTSSRAETNYTVFLRPLTTAQVWIAKRRYSDPEVSRGITWAYIIDVL